MRCFPRSRLIGATFLGTVAMAAAFAMSNAALAQLSLTPSAEPKTTTQKPAAPKPAARAKTTFKAIEQKKPAEQPSSASPETDDPKVDLAYGAYQVGLYRTARDIAAARAEKGDVKAMALLGELYANANGMGIKRDDAKAVEWYSRAADRGDREAMFALAMLKIAGRGGPADRNEAAKLLASSAKLGKAAAAYNLGLLYLEGQTFPQDLKRAAELFRQAANAGNAEAQYALATFYKEGRGVEKDLTEAAKLLRAAAIADNVDAEVEYAIALYNGTGTPKDVPTAVALLNRAARQNSPIAQNRLAWVLINGQGAPMDKIEGFKWHLIAKTAGKGDPDLDAQLAQLTPIDRAKAEAGAKKWFGLK